MAKEEFLKYWFEKIFGKQDNLLTELEKKADLTETQPVEIVAPVDSNNNVNVNLVNNTNASVILPLVQELGETTLSVDGVIDEYIVTVTSVVGIAVGQHFRIINYDADRFYFGTILGISGNDITLDTPLDFAYLSGSEITYSNINMNVDGSVTPIKFKLRTGSPSIPSLLDITRLIFYCTASSSVDLNKFGNLASLTNGIVFRRVNNSINNIFNVKTNGELASLMYDWNPYQASNPAQAIDGFVSRLTFAGQNKIGVALRVGSDDNIEIIVQDDLSLLTSFIVIAEGHVVSD